MKIENPYVILLVNLLGGSYVDFHYKDLLINPINWHSKESETPAYNGHFLCFDRWGPPTGAEAANGFTHHGEANTENWKVLSEPENSDGVITCSMMCSLPMGGLQLRREIALSEDEPVFFVKEEIKNQNKYGRMFNMVQHVTLVPPFLDHLTLFDNNTEKGFEDKEDGSLNQEKPILKWPEAIHKGETVNLRQFQGEWPRVSSFVYNQKEKYGWATACNPAKNLLLGYLWKIEEYPWINFWRFMEDANPKAFGMEFGTTGLHEPFPIVAKKGKIFDRNNYDFIDADEVITKSFTAFLSKIPQDYNGVRQIEVRDSSFIIKENAPISRDITYHTGIQGFDKLPL